MMLELGQSQIPSESTSLPVASRVKTSVLRGSERESPAIAADCTQRSCESLAFYDQESLLWKMWQRCLWEGWVSFAQTWPRSGIAANGELFRLPDLVRHTRETEFSYWPTAMASDQLRLGISRAAFLKASARNKRLGHGAGPASGNLVSQFQIDFDGCPSVEFAEWLMGFPQNWTALDSED